MDNEIGKNGLPSVPFLSFTRIGRYSQNAPFSHLTNYSLTSQKTMKEIRTQDWNKFCQKLNENERGATVDIHWIDRETQAEKSIARAAVLEEFSFGQRDGCTDHILVRAGGEAGARHEIVEPIHILLRESSKNGDFNAITVEAEGGSTILTFSPAIHREWIKEMV